jgi:hypothetical protein
MYAPTIDPADDPYTESNTSTKPRETIAAAIPADTAPLIPPPSMDNDNIALSLEGLLDGVDLSLTR